MAREAVLTWPGSVPARGPAVARSARPPGYELGGTVTGYYEPVLHGDTRSTRKARFPVYGIPNDFVSVELPAGLRNSKTTVRVRPTGQNKGAVDANGTYTADLSQFPITARSCS